MNVLLTTEFRCNIGGCNFSTKNNRVLFNHFRQVHENDKEFKSNCLLAGSCTDSTLYKTFWGLNTHIRRHHTDFFSNPADSQGSMTNEDQLLGWFYNHFNHKITWITIFILVSNEDFLGAVENNTDSGENVASLEQLTHSAGISTWKSSSLRGLNNLRVVVFNTWSGGFLIRGLKAPDSRCF